MQIDKLEYTYDHRYAQKLCSIRWAQDGKPLMLEHWCGLRAGEVAAPRIAGIVDEQRTVKAEIVLAAAVTKSKRARCIFVPRQM